MTEKNRHIWPTVEPATLDQMIKYKKGELNDLEANKLEMFLSDFDADLLDDLSVADLQSLKGIEVTGAPKSTKGWRSELRIAASIIVVGVILSLAYIILDKTILDDEVIVQHEQSTQESTEELPVASNLDETSEAESESTQEVEESEIEETSEIITEKASGEQESEEEVVANKTSDNPNHKEENGAKKVASMEADELVATEDDMLGETAKASFKMAEKEKLANPEEVVVYTIIEKYNDPKDKPADVPKRARAFAKSTVGVSKNTYRRKVSPSFPGGDDELIKWFRDNYNPLLEAKSKAFKLSFTVTKKAKLIDAKIDGLPKSEADALLKKLKSMTDWNKPESGYDPLDIYYSIYIEPNR